MGLPTDIRLVEAEAYFQTEGTRHGLAFGRQRTTDLTLCHVRVRVENRRGHTADGWGAVFLSHPWALARTALGDAEKAELMRALVVSYVARAAEHRGFGHPLDVFADLEPEWGSRSREVTRRLGHDVEVPRLARLVCASPLDAAIHDAFGVVNDVSSYAAYGPEHSVNDLSAHLGPAFTGRYASEFLRPAAVRVPVAHTVGLKDELVSSGGRPDDDEAPPSTLDRWIARDGVYSFKVKLGGALEWDLERLIDIHEVASAAVPESRGREIQLSVDLNGEGGTTDFVVELLRRVRELSPAAFSALRYVEQPVAPEAEGDVRDVAALKPVILDEAFTGLDDLTGAPGHGWSGVALKTCKCQSLTLLAVARAESLGLGCVMQDLSNVGIAFLQSIGVAARLPILASVEANGRQYYPEASAPESIAHPDVMRVRDGMVSTATLGGRGLGYEVARIPRPLFHEGRARD